MKTACFIVAGLILFVEGAYLHTTPTENIMQQILVSTMWTNMWLMILAVLVVGSMCGRRS